MKTDGRADGSCTYLEYCVFWRPWSAPVQRYPLFFHTARHLQAEQRRPLDRFYILSLLFTLLLHLSTGARRHKTQSLKSDLFLLQKYEKCFNSHYVQRAVFNDYTPQPSCPAVSCILGVLVGCLIKEAATSCLVSIGLLYQLVSDNSVLRQYRLIPIKCR